MACADETFSLGSFSSYSVVSLSVASLVFVVAPVILFRFSLFTSSGNAFSLASIVPMVIR